MHFEISEIERETLARFLTNALRGKRVEIHRTESAAFRSELEQEETILNGLLKKLQQESHADSH